MPLKIAESTNISQIFFSIRSLAYISGQLGLKFVLSLTLTRCNSSQSTIGAQIVLDMVNGVWTSKNSARTYDKLLSVLNNDWDLITLVHAADVNEKNDADVLDARAIQYFVHNKSWS